jgi:hypothetical protein
LKRVELLAGWYTFRQLLVQNWPEVRQSIQILDERAAYGHVQGAHPGQPLCLDTSVPPRLCTASLHGQRSSIRHVVADQASPLRGKRYGTIRIQRAEGLVDKRRHLRGATLAVSEQLPRVGLGIKEG